MGRVRPTRAPGLLGATSCCGALGCAARGIVFRGRSVCARGALLLGWGVGGLSFPGFRASLVAWPRVSVLCPYVWSLRDLCEREVPFRGDVRDWSLRAPLQLMPVCEPGPPTAGAVLSESVKEKLEWSAGTRVCSAMTRQDGGAAHRHVRGSRVLLCSSVCEFARV